MNARQAPGGLRPGQLATCLDGRARASVLRDGRGRHWAAFASIHDLHRFAGQHPDVRLDELVGD